LLSLWYKQPNKGDKMKKVFTKAQRATWYQQRVNQWEALLSEVNPKFHELIERPYKSDMRRLNTLIEEIKEERYIDKHHEIFGDKPESK
jgi:DNA anti-recombination protein RmuC